MVKKSQVSYQEKLQLLQSRAYYQKETSLISWYCRSQRIDQS